MKRLPTILCGMLLSTALQAAEPATTATPAATPSPATPPSAAQVLAPTRTATPASTPTPAATPDTAPAAAPSPGPAAATPPAGPADATAAAAGQASPPARRGASDRVELGATQITGNAELPRVMYVVPWKRTELGDLAGKPARSLLDEVLAPVDRDVFRRQVRYYEALRPDEQPKEP